MFKRIGMSVFGAVCATLWVVLGPFARLLGKAGNQWILQYDEFSGFDTEVRACEFCEAEFWGLRTKVYSDHKYLICETHRARVVRHQRAVRKLEK